MASPDALSIENRFLIDFNVPSVPAVLGLDVPDAAAAAMLGVDVLQVSAYIRQAETTVRKTAHNLLQRPDLSDALDHWSLSPGSTVLAVGDSITTYRYSYARILAAMLDIRRGVEDIRFVNVGQSGYTSSLGLETTYSQNLAHQPDWVFIMFGVNDCKQFGGDQARTLVSVDEYRVNMSLIVDAYRRFTDARIVLLTPTPVVESTTDANPDFAAMRLSWRNANLAACSEIIRSLADENDLGCVDLMSVFAPDPNLFLADGLHPNPTGHQIILEKTLQHLSK